MSRFSEVPPEVMAQLGNFLTDDEVEKLALFRVYAGGPEPVPEQEILDTLEWAQRVRMASAMLDAVLAGGAFPVGLKDKGDPHSMQLKLTPKGEAEGARLHDLLRRQA